MADSKRRVSNRSTKRKSPATESKEDSCKKVRRCDKAGCGDLEPSCCLQTFEGCTKAGYTSRWYHMSLGEHFCNNCFDNLYRPGRPGNLLFNDWINDWSGVARVSKPTIKRYVASELLPFWVKCTHGSCDKWRRINKAGTFNSEFIKTFKCPMASKSCTDPEDKLVALAADPYFVDQLTEAPLLRKSPAATYLKRFLPEDIGVCPLDFSNLTLDDVDDIEPFLLGQCGEASIWPKPDSMDEDEMQFMTNTLISSATYLGIRNLIVALWNLSPKEWLDVNKVNAYVICRGLIRIHLLSLADLVLKLLTRKSVINYGIIESPHLTISKNSEADVLVIGAGISGLAAAKHLQNLGVNVTIFEASSDIGGRVEDNPLISKAYFVKGLLNNPFTILAMQANQDYQKLQGKALVFDSKGKLVPSELEEKLQYRLRGITQGALEEALQSGKDCNWHDIITDNFNKFIKTSSIQTDDKLFRHILELFQIELGADFRNLSLLNWESTTAVKGDNAFFLDGIKNILKRLAENLKIVFDTEVKNINYKNEKVKVVTTNREYIFSKVLITVPLPVLRDEGIKFFPSLPDFKQKAFESLGDYYCAKLIIQFPRKFWASNQTPFREFGIISEQSLFPLFLDITADKKNSAPTLVVFIPSQALDILKDKSDKNIVDMCVQLLKHTFGKKKDIPLPSKWFLSNCKKAKGSSYGSYIKVGSKQDVFDDMAKAVDDKLFFAGEATFRNIPGCMTGAYLSGLREAAKISEHFELF